MGLINMLIIKVSFYCRTLDSLFCQVTNSCNIRFKTADTMDLEQFKFGDNNLLSQIVSRYLVVYDGKLVKIGVHSCSCKCSAYNSDFSIRNTFFCDGCGRLHQYRCSLQEEEELIANEYLRTEINNYCLACKVR